MRSRIRTAVPALLLASALTATLSACNNDEDTAGGKPDKTASSSQDGGNGGDASGGEMDNAQPVAVPLPASGELTSASAQEEKVLVLRYQPEGPAEEAVEANLRMLAKNGYEAHEEGPYTRGDQTVNVGADGDAVQYSITYPDAAPPLPSEGDVLSVTSKDDDTLTFTYGLPEDATTSLSALKTYVGELGQAGWDTPTDGSTTATKGDQKIEFDVTDDTQLKVTVDVPSSVG
ncbi:hypothetical protein [Streptomyces sp. NPDC047108]|uniref:hypothetical protein n=1 Tax=Streptomyces sp. NPDC047108 TaxID=3155025 RepID=UPI0033E3FB80